MTPYVDFLERVAELTDLTGAQALLSWDQETYMPPGSQQARARQGATLGAIAHQRFTSPEMGALLERLEGP
ncbi:carboxypeptidase M32, partial [bacterium]|nr:carboxypeptidase M32 [bacterium]